MKAESWNGVRIKQKKAGSDWLGHYTHGVIWFQLIITFSDEGKLNQNYHLYKTERKKPCNSIYIPMREFNML
jgi:hypothetical protein